MQVKIFVIPIFNSEVANEELNKFLRSHRVIEMSQEFVSLPNGAYYCFCIRYLSGGSSFFGKKEKVDYRKVLDDDTFAKFEKLRRCRKEIAKRDAVPAYAVFTDSELAEIAKLSEITAAFMQRIKGIGEKKVEKYGKLLADMYLNYEKSGKIDS